MRVAAQFASVEEAVAGLHATDAEVAILGADVSSGAGATLAAVRPGLRFIAVVPDTDAELARSALRAGAAGVALRHTSVAAMLRAIRQVAAGDVWIDSRLIPPLTETSGDGRADQFRDSLTSRECDVLDALLEGCSNRAIGERLGVSEGAVKAALHRIFAKVGARSRGQLVKLAVEGAGRKGAMT